LASREVPVMVGLRLFLPESWTEGTPPTGTALFDTGFSWSVRP
jgi:hypothetical protein